MNYKFFFILLISLPTLGGQHTTIQKLNLKNKTYTLSRIAASPLVPGIIGLGSGLAGSRYVTTPLTAKLVKKMDLQSKSGKLVAACLKNALSVVAAYKVYDYASTWVNSRAWPEQAAHCVQVLVNDLAVLQSLRFHSLFVSLSDTSWPCKIEELIDKHYLPSIDAAIKKLNDVCFEICDAHTIELIQALEDDVAAMRSGAQLEFEYETLIAVACDDVPLCVQLNLLKSKILLGNVYTTLGYGVHAACLETLQQQQEAFNQAIAHCERLASAQNGWDMMQGGYEYLKWSLGQWWRARFGRD